MNFPGMIRALLSGGIKGHFGQWAEDVLIRKLFPTDQNRGVYLDIGAYHPFIHSNTAFFWLSGWKGFNVDANPNTIELFKKARPRDTNIWCAVIPESEYQAGVQVVPLHLPDRPDHHSGISATGAVNQLVGQDRQFSRSVQVPAKSIRALIEEHGISNIEYLNIDIEGQDLAILSELDLDRLRPRVISIEDYSDHFADTARSAIASSMKDKGYGLVGRAGPTSIYMAAT